MRIFFDTEFFEDGRTIDLISIGMVREDGAEYYAVNAALSDLRLVSDSWLVENVFPSLPYRLVDPNKPVSWPNVTRVPSSEWKLPETIAKEIKEFAGDSPEFWAYFADYDWVVLCQLYGRMIDLPRGWPMYCRDLRQLADTFPAEVTLLPQSGQSQHNALEDARWVRDALPSIGNQLGLKGKRPSSLWIDYHTHPM